MLDKKVVLAGYSGHGYVVLDAARKCGFKVQGYMDLKINSRNFFNLDYLGCESQEGLPLWKKDFAFILGVGNNLIRKQTAQLILSHGKKILNVIHPSVDSTDIFTMGYGNFLGKNVSITSLVEVGNCNILNTGCVVDHECKLGNFTHIGPGAVLAGNVEIGDGSFVGANSVIREGVVIGENSLIGAGAVVLHDVPKNTKVVGNPARYIP